MSDKYGNDRDPYLYPELNVMRNRLGIRQAERLAQAAYEFTALRAATLPLGPLLRGLPHLCAIHQHLYQDILTGRVIFAKWIFIRGIPGSVTSPISKKRGMP